MKKKINKLSGSIFWAVCFFALSVSGVMAAEVYLPTFGETGLPTPLGGVIGVLAAFLGWILLVAGFLCIIAFVIAGIIYLTSAGDEDQAKRAKRAMFYAIIGVVISLSGIVVIRLIYTLLGGPLGMWFL